MRILILMAIAIAVFLLWPQHQAKTLKKPVRPLIENSSCIYRDSSYSAYLANQEITVLESSSGRITRIPAPPAYNTKNCHAEESPAKAVRGGDILKVSYRGTIFAVLLNPEVRLKSVYPDPGCRGDKIIIDKNKNILYLYQKGDLSGIYPVSTGKKPEYTPEGNFTIKNKISLPPEPGKERFGPRWLGIGVPCEFDLRTKNPDSRAPRGIKYGIHGTDEPQSIGTYASAGCIRLKNSHIIELYEKVEVGTPVEIIR